MNADAALLTELHRLRHELPEVSGSLLSGMDGMLIVSDLPGNDAHHTAALSAASTGVGRRFVHLVGYGPLQECVVRGAGGCVAVYPAGGHAILAVVARPDADLSRLHPAARTVAKRVGTRWGSMRRQLAATAVPPATDPHAPLAVRTPMATLPAGLWFRKGRRG